MKQMMNDETFKLRAWKAVLKDIEKEFGGTRSVCNIIQNIEARIKWHKEHAKDNK